jgi:hypothetical protein
MLKPLNQRPALALRSGHKMLFSALSSLFSVSAIQRLIEPLKR